jgi:methyl-accepting chemotaxis protein
MEIANILFSLIFIAVISLGILILKRLKTLNDQIQLIGRKPVPVVNDISSQALQREIKNGISSIVSCVYDINKTLAGVTSIAEDVKEIDKSLYLISSITDDVKEIDKSLDVISGIADDVKEIDHSLGEIKRHSIEAKLSAIESKLENISVYLVEISFNTDKQAELVYED